MAQKPAATTNAASRRTRARRPVSGVIAVMKVFLERRGEADREY
jgi:hypothetical protein